MYIKRQDVSVFEKLTAQLASSHQEVSALSKKAPNGSLNAFKLKLINAVLERCNTFFGREYRPFPDFSSFSLDDMPTNSDASFVLSQYLECAEKYRADRISQWGGRWTWDIIKDEPSKAQGEQSSERDAEEADSDDDQGAGEEVSTEAIQPVYTSPPKKLAHK